MSCSSSASWPFSTAWKPDGPRPYALATPIVARDLLRAHHETYRTFWRWSDAALDTAMLTGSLHTVFGWQVHIGENPNPRTLAEFSNAGKRRRNDALGGLPGNRARRRGLRPGT